MGGAEKWEATYEASIGQVGVVAIGRNEGARLLRCFDSLQAALGAVVYVDSASTDGSVEQARRRGIEVVELDMAVPFTAARARNAGLRRLRECHPGLRFVQFVDGDCVLVTGWIEGALSELSGDARRAMVCGRRREARPDSSIYNRLADMEWDTSVGETESCGGDSLARMEAVIEVGGFDDALIAGEEPEMCARLRTRGWTIARLDREMTVHDAAMTRFSQWWRRSVRSGYGFADAGARHPEAFRRERRSGLIWGLAVPVAAALSAPVSGTFGLALLLAYPVLWARILRGRHARGAPLRDAALYASFCLLGKFPQAAGTLQCWWDRSRRRRRGLIEYK